MVETLFLYTSSLCWCIFYFFLKKGCRVWGDKVFSWPQQLDSYKHSSEILPNGKTYEDMKGYNKAFVRIEHSYTACSKAKKQSIQGRNIINDLVLFPTFVELWSWKYGVLHILYFSLYLNWMVELPPHYAGKLFWSPAKDFMYWLRCVEVKTHPTG